MVRKIFLLILSAMIVMALCSCEKSRDVYSPADAKGIALPVVMYHSIVDSAEREGKYVIRPSLLERDMKYLKDNGYTAVLPDELYEYVNGGGKLPEKPVMLTFDDGFYNNLVYALPLLEKYDMKAVISVVGKFTEDETNRGEKQSSKYSYLTWEQVKELGDSGRVAIGNHSYNMHGESGRKGTVRRKGESEAAYAGAVGEDIRRMQDVTLEKTGIKMNVFTYPFGAITKTSEKVVKEMGFIMSLSCYEHVNTITRDESCLYSLGRYSRPAGSSPESFFGAMTVK